MARPLLASTEPDGLRTVPSADGGEGATAIGSPWNADDRVLGLQQVGDALHRSRPVRRCQDGCVEAIDGIKHRPDIGHVGVSTVARISSM
jgi:hypothetical protein